MEYVGIPVGSDHLEHYGRVGMKWGKHIFGNEIAGAVRRAAGRARTSSVIASTRASSQAKRAYSRAKSAYSSLAKAANKTSVGKRINQARVSAAMAKALNSAKTPDANAVRKEWSFRNRRNMGTYAEFFSLMKRLGIV